MRESDLDQNLLLGIYFKGMPSFLLPFLEAKALRRLKGVGMNCGTEYTSLPFFSSLPPSSRYSHSLGVALLAYRFSFDKKMALAGLFHDIASPCFAHTVDFLNGDYEKQESTEEGTASILYSDPQIRKELRRLDIDIDEVSRDFLYPIVNNPSPHLSCDRLEYTLRNIYLFGYGNLDKIEGFCRDLIPYFNEAGQIELQFKSKEIAADFATLALKTSKVYISNEDRFAMEALSQTLCELLKRGIIAKKDLMKDEPTLLKKIARSEEGRKLFAAYRSLSEVVEENGSDSIRVKAKVRYIDPLVLGRGRVSDIDPSLKEEMANLLESDFAIPLKGIYGEG